MTTRVASTFVAILFLLAAVGGTNGATTSNTQSAIGNEDSRKKAGFDPRQFPGEDLTPLLKDKKFSNGKHPLKTFADGSKLTIETKNGKIRRAFFTDLGGSTSAATIHSPAGTPTARSFTVGVHVGQGTEACFICTFGRDGQQQSGGSQPRRRHFCHRAPCDDFFPEPDPPTLDPP